MTSKVLKQVKETEELSFHADNSGLKRILGNLGNSRMVTSGDYLVTASFLISGGVCRNNIQVHDTVG
jgi:hypothetical protein